MGVLVEDIRIASEFTPSTTTDYLLGNIGDKVTIEIDFRAEDVFVTGAEEEVDRIMLAPQPYRVNNPDSKDVIYCEDLDALTNYKVGDSIGLSITASTYLIYEKLSDQAFKVTDNVGGAVDFYASNGNNYDTTLIANDYVYVKTPLTSIIYRYNFNENRSDGTFNSLIDNEVNRMVSSAAVINTVATPIPLTFASPSTNDIGSAYVKGNGATATGQRFTIVHETYITPFFTAENINDFKNNIATNQLSAESSLKYITSIDVGRNDNDPNFISTVDFAANNGNVGWFGENFNGNGTNYYIDSVVYKRLDTSIIDSVELTPNEQTVEIIVKNTVDNPFDATTPFTLNFSIMPDDVDDYRNNGKTIDENFYFDRGFSLVDGATVAGKNLGTDIQIIKEVSSTLTGADEILITATLLLSTDAITDLTSRDGIEYFFWVSTQNGALDTEEADKISLRLPYKTFYIDLTDDGLLSFEDKFLRHYESDIETEGTLTPIVRTEDDVLVRSRFAIDRLTRETDEILLSSVSGSLIMIKTDGSEFVLETFSQSLNGTQVIGDSQYIDESSERAFKMPDNDIRKTINVKRRDDLDTADLRYYDILYPFLMRWEYWIALSGVNGDAFDTSLDNNGQNEDWQRYDTITDWDVYYRTNVSLTKNGEFLTYQNDTLLTTFDYEEDTDWDTETIVALDADTLTPTGSLLISPTRIKASKTYVGGSAPDLADVEWVVRIEVYEQGGISEIRYLSSVYDWTQYSWLESIDNSNKVVKTVLGAVYSADFLIDASKLPQASKFKISARIYNEAALVPVTFCILEEDLTPILEENAIDCIEIEHI